MIVKRKSGQILVLVLLVVVVALAVGLSAASRNLVNLKSSTQAEQSQRAFTAAEGGVEDVLSKIPAVSDVILTGNPTTECTKVDTTSANCTLQISNGEGNVKVVQKKAYERNVELGDVAQVNLDLYTGDVTIEWIKTGDLAQSTLEFTFVCQSVSGTCMGDAMSGGYGQHREFYTNGASIPSGQSGVSSCTVATAPFTCKKVFNIAVANVKFLRIKPFWSRTTVNITPGNVSAFPVQTYEITSTATTNTGVSRKVEVRRDALPQLPAIFDYVLYSGGDIEK
ncbi:MAG: hypothetical protein UU23_C0001G0062 [Candidatus Curtissbacteria bacterium GW2011_GWA1_40_9]|uniref:Type 4 fimbrial biogenesis protein PilX N-terminal domain-containing protein n=1 Tax=Candidatus Curtissbacteria bacterium GW2011_GWA1_40_9 TaxID=1618408 RepID=A0A0G0TMS7_9BACT|nr:MAG: hypothetical protein UU23_C0001G0062 [Candidatus Curtissbacteria bacterium GW2011_GWA1_40_9]